jgi:precorrin-3B synthase
MRRGWCPSLLRPMESGDGWLVRVRPREAVLTDVVLRGIADASARFGNGVVEITNRANLQVRGLRRDTILPFTEAMRAVGIDEATQDRQAVLVSPLLGADPTIAPETGPIARAIAAGLAEGADLPGKFGVLIDGGGALPLTGISLDVTLRAVGEVWTLQGEPVAAEVVASQAIALVREAVRRRPERSAPAPRLGSYAPGGAMLFSPEFGQLRAEALAKLADLARRYGAGGLRPTPWKSFAIAGVSDVAALRTEIDVLGLITDPADPRLGLVTCAGAPACLRGELETHEVARALATVRRPANALWHVSGCVKGCAHPGPAAVTLVGNYRLMNLIRGGTAGDLPDRRALTLAETLNLMQSLPA